jgi:monoamine oxidase
MPYHTLIDEQLSAIEAADHGRPRKRILILGAGMAGLCAGYELARRGHQIELVEASARPGGRVWTRRFDDKTHGELGAMRVPASHDYTRHYLQLVELAEGMRPFIGTSRLYRYHGQTLRTHKEVAGAFPLNPCDRQTVIEEGLDGIFVRVMGRLIDSLSEEDKRNLFSDRLCSERLREIDLRSLRELLDEETEPGAVDLTGWGIGIADLWDNSLTLFLREEIEGAFRGLEEVPGGLDQLPSRLADLPIPSFGSLREHTRFKTEVTGLSLLGDQVEIRLKDSGGERRQVADWVICTLPYTVLRQIELQGLTPAKLDAIRHLQYTASTKVLLRCKTRVWENEEDRICGGFMPSDEELRQTYYPSDNPKCCIQEKSDGPGVVLGSYTWGASARTMAELPPEQRVKLVQERLEKIHPGIGQTVDGQASMAWSDFKWSRGAFGALAPGEMQRHFPAASDPEGRLAVAGEHISPFQSWIQGALWSTLRAVHHIVSEGNGHAA